MNDTTQPASNQRILYLFTRTPLHVGAGSSVGAIDQPIIRERHTGFPVIPGTSLKGTFADAWNDSSMQDRRYKRVLKRDDNSWDDGTDAAWLFGSDDANHAFAGALQFSEARLLAFPIRSARGSFAWITCPLMLHRAARDGVLDQSLLGKLEVPKDDEAIFDAGAQSKLDLKGQIVLEEYTFKLAATWMRLTKLGEALVGLLPDDPVWGEVKDRLVILSDGMMSFFARNACEIAQHVRISDKTGTAEDGALFNQENVPSETLFYAVLHALGVRTTNQNQANHGSAVQALAAFRAKTDGQVFQFGGDASTGLGYCSVRLPEEKGA